MLIGEEGIKMNFIIKYVANSKAGKFAIAQSEDGRFHPIYNEESLGRYDSAEQALDDLIANATCSVLHKGTGKMLDTSAIGLPEDLSDWEQ
jgi:hypothetical protein